MSSNRSAGRLLVPLTLAAGAVYAAPRLFRRAFAPPRRDSVHTPADLGLPEEEVWLESLGGTRLHGWFIPVAGPAPAVIVLHGWGGNASLMLPLAPHLHEAGFHSFFLDVRNHGLSEHDRFVSLPRFAEDLDVAAGWLAANPAVTTIGVVGHSVGAGAAILSASQDDKFAAVVSLSALAHPGEMMRHQMRRLPKVAVDGLLLAVQKTIGQRFDEFAPRARIGLVRAPVMLVHGGADRVVPVGNVFDLAAARPDAEIFIVPEAGHSDLALFESHVGVIIDFLSENLRQTTSASSDR